MTDRLVMRPAGYGGAAPPPAVTGVLRHRRVLVAGEDAFVLGYVSSVLETAGARLVGPLAAADVALAPDGIDGAVVELSAGAAWAALADGLAVAGVPFVLVSGHVPGIPLFRHRDRPLLPRPFAAFQIIDALVALLAPT